MRIAYITNLYLLVFVLEIFITIRTDVGVGAPLFWLYLPPTPINGPAGKVPTSCYTFLAIVVDEPYTSFLAV